MFARVRRYAFLNAKLKTRISLMLSDDFFRRLASCKNLDEAIPMLSESGYADAAQMYSRTGDLKMAELALFSRELQTFSEIRKYTDDSLSAFFDAMLLRYETGTMKQAFRLWFDQTIRKRDISVEAAYLPREIIIRKLPLNEMIAAPDADALLEVLSNNTATPAYADMFREHRGYIEENRSIFRLEMALDRFFYARLKVEADRLPAQDRDIVSRIVGVEIDMENISRVIRLQTFYSFDAEQLKACILPGGYRTRTENIPGGELSNTGYPALSALAGNILTDSSSTMHKNLELLHSVLSGIIHQEIRKMLGGNPFTIGILLSYFLLARHEVRRIASILNGIAYNLDDERKRRL